MEYGPLFDAEFGDASADFGERLGELVAADGVGGGDLLPLQLGAGEAQRLQALFALGVLDDAAAAHPSLLQFVETILDSRLGVNKSFRAVPHSLLFAPRSRSGPTAWHTRP